MNFIDYGFIGVSLSGPIVEASLEICGTPRDCRGVMLSAYRFLPELRVAGLADEVIELFPDEAECAYLSGWRMAKASDTLIERYSGRP